MSSDLMILPIDPTAWAATAESVLTPYSCVDGGNSMQLLHFSISCCLYKLFYLNPVGDGPPCTGPGFITIASKAVKVIVQGLRNTHAVVHLINSFTKTKRVALRRTKAKDLKADWKRKDFCIYNAFRDFHFCVVYCTMISFKNTVSAQIRLD